MYNIANDVWDAAKIEREAGIYGLSLEEVREIVRCRGKVSLIKKIRGTSGLGIREGKAVVDGWTLGRIQSL